MKEILFRGKRKDNGEWVEGAFYAYYNFKRTIVQILKDRTNGTPDAYDVIPETVGQYTGLTDKNGTKIFEGDIIKQEYSLSKQTRAILSVIEYGIAYAYSNVYGVCQRFSDGSGTAMLSVGDNIGTVFCEVIGNIHDNPELIGGDTND